MNQDGIFEARRDGHVLDPVRVESPAQNVGGVQLLDVRGCLEQAHSGSIPNYD
jgi:hypothetical protein